LGFIIKLLFEALIYPGLLTMVILVIVTQWYLRKLAGRIQYRRGPTYTGPAGFLQPLADFLKLLSKEDIVNKYGLKYSPLVLIVLAIGVLIIYAATSTGVFKTTNGGTNWTQQLWGNFIDLDILVIINYSYDYWCYSWIYRINGCING